MNTTLLSLAILKTNWDSQKKDYIENFIPFVAELIERRKYDAIDDNLLSKGFAAEFGLIIPSHPSITILNRARKRGLIRREQTRYVVDSEKVEQMSFGKKSLEQQRKLGNIISELKSYALTFFGRVIEEKEIEDAFISFLSDHELEILFASEHGSPLPEVKNPQAVRYIVAKFITDCSQNRPELFKNVVDIVVGHTLATTILYDRLSSFSGKFDNVRFFFDTRFIVRLLGLEGEPRQKSAEELVQLLTETKAQLRVFDLTLSEVNGILDDCMNKLQKGVIDISTESRAVRYLVRNNKTSSDVELLMIRLPSLLDELHMKSDPLPEFFVLNQHQIDEKALFDLIVEVYSTFDPTFNETAREKTVRRDVLVMSGIYKLRKGVHPQIIRDARALFVSPNTALAYASRRFEAKVNGMHFSIPSCVTDVFLGTLIWLQSPAKVQAINEKKIIADCFAAMQPSESLLRKYISAVEQLKIQGKITADQYYLLRSHRAASNLLEEKTLGDPEAFEGKTAEEILDDIVSIIKAQERQLLEDEKIRHRNTLQLLDDEKRKLSTIESSVDRRIEQLARTVANTVAAALFIIFAVSLLYRFFPDIYPSLGEFKNWLLGLGLLLAVIGLGVGFNILSTRDKFQKRLIGMLRRFLKGR